MSLSNDAGTSHSSGSLDKVGNDYTFNGGIKLAYQFASSPFDIGLYYFRVHTNNSSSVAPANGVGMISLPTEWGRQLRYQPQLRLQGAINIRMMWCS